MRPRSTSAATSTRWRTPPRVGSGRSPGTARRPRGGRPGLRRRRPAVHGGGLDVRDGTAWERVSGLPAGDWTSDVVSVNGTFVAIAERCAGNAAWPSCSGPMTGVPGARCRWTCRRPRRSTPPARPSCWSPAITAASRYAHRPMGRRGRCSVRCRPRTGSTGVAPVLVARPDGGIDLLIRFDPRRRAGVGGRRVHETWRSPRSVRPRAGRTGPRTDPSQPGPARSLPLRRCPPPTPPTPPSRT